jgi:hypothetical protein
VPGNRLAWEPPAAATHAARLTWSPGDIEIAGSSSNRKPPGQVNLTSRQVSELGWREEPRGKEGQWQKFYHASPHAFEVGDLITPGHVKVSGVVGRAGVPDTDPDKVYFTDSLDGAKKFSRNTNVYEVEPTGPIATDKHFPAAPGVPGMYPAYKEGETPTGMAYESEQPLRVVRKLTNRTIKNDPNRVIEYGPSVSSPSLPGAPHTASLAGTITAQLELAHWEGWRDEPRDRHGRWTRGAAAVLERVVDPIRDEGARGNSRPVSEEEFHRYAAEGRDRLHAIQASDWSTKGLDSDWAGIKARTYAEVQKSWGGATVDPRTGDPLPDGVDKFAMSVKPTGLDTTSVSEHASEAEFSQAMDIARSKYGKQLAKGGSYLGIFHDDDLNRIDIDPVTVLDNLHDVETIGAYTHAIGGAYRFSDGNGYWPPHVPSGAAMSADDGHWAGPGQWHSHAVAVQQPHDEPEDTEDGKPAVGLSANVHVDPQALKEPGLPVPDDPAAVAMFTAHRLDRTMHELAHATERHQAAQSAGGKLRAYHTSNIARHLQNSLDTMHNFVSNLREHYPAEAAELEQVRQAVGLAKSVSPAAKAATTAHLTETVLHELTHGQRHALAMMKDDPDGKEWKFDSDHCGRHLDGAVEHAGKLTEHFTDNYPAVAEWLGELGDIAEQAGEEQHARYSGTGKQLAATLGDQLELAWSAAEKAEARAKAHATASATARRDYLRDEKGRFAEGEAAKAASGRVYRGQEPGKGDRFYVIDGDDVAEVTRGTKPGTVHVVHGDGTSEDMPAAFEAHPMSPGSFEDPTSRPVGPAPKQAFPEAASSAAAQRLMSQSAASVPGMFSRNSHLDWDGKPPTVFPDASNRGTIAEIDWNGHVRINQSTASHLAEDQAGTSQVSDPFAYSIPLHEMIHAVVPAGQSRRTNGDMKAYQDYGHAQVEEGFTELGTVQHAHEFFDATGVSGRETPLLNDTADADDEATDSGLEHYTMGEYADLLNTPQRIKAGDAWGHYAEQTRQAYEWASLIAQAHTGKPETAAQTQAETRRIADAVNAVGTAAKPGVMARESVGDMLTSNPGTDNQVLSAAAGAILQNWAAGQSGGAAHLAARAAARQKVQQIRAEQEKAAVLWRRRTRARGLS